MRMITIATALFFFTTSVNAQKNVDLRLNPASFDADKKELYVDVQIRYAERGTFVLAGQNYRLFYNSESLHLDKDGSTSDLPSKRYADLKIVENVEGISADEVNQLDFDDNLGFVNLSIDLKDNKNGGISIQKKDSWTSVATLKFRVNETMDNYEVVWGREGRSDLYATAYVEVSEWLDPFSIKTVEVNYFEDLMIENGEVQHIITPSISVGPNPATDFIQIALNQPLNEQAQVTITDISGRTLKNATIYEGQISMRLELDQLSSANYFIEIHSDKGGSLHKESFIVAK